MTELKLPAFADASDPLHCLVFPSSNAAMFGERLNEYAFAFAVWSIELDAFWLWSSDCEPPSFPF